MLAAAAHLALLSLATNSQIVGNTFTTAAPDRLTAPSVLPGSEHNGFQEQSRWGISGIFAKPINLLSLVIARVLPENGLVFFPVMY